MMGFPGFFNVFVKRFGLENIKLKRFVLHMSLEQLSIDRKLSSCGFEQS